VLGPPSRRFSARPEKGGAGNLRSNVLYLNQRKGDDMTKEEQKEWDLKLRKMDAEISNLNAATGQLTIETSYYVLFRGIALGAGLLGAGAAFAKVFLV